ncbi:RHS repeat-associated core domain-containing protein [Streptomyces sp. NPDC057798]|uniref:RHS repeat-associated core domain-containing protein n=1 Tax=Streptomyces sp. NPDC057798 TaxID=3346252 RepID=UPI0036B262CA
MGLVDDAGKRSHTYAYGPTGLPRGTTTEAAPQPYRYTGTYLDPTGLYKMGHRYYDPQLGRPDQQHRPDRSGHALLHRRSLRSRRRRQQHGRRCPLHTGHRRSQYPCGLRCHRRRTGLRRSRIGDDR